MKDLDKNEQAAYMANLRARSTTMNNSPVLSLDELREQFEAHYPDWEFDRSSMNQDNYIFCSVQDSWKIWLACAIQNGVVKQ